MVKKVIQVPIDKDLLYILDRVSKRQKKARAVLIREACSNYLRQVENEELDRTYEQGYKKIPEETAIGEVQAKLAGRVLPRESW